MKKISLGFAAALLLVSCATIGTNFDEARLTELQPGKTTVTDARKILGEPYQTVNVSNGHTVLTWQYIMSTGVGTTSNKLASVQFGPDRRMVGIQHLINIPMSEADAERLRVQAQTRSP
tara:strand:- start:1406 stop:1762 length:357 start_codon:yes stop_codon:yes gene_type:complete